MQNSKRPTRVDVRRPATIINADGGVQKVTILDLSSSGFRLQVSEPLREGELIRLCEGPHYLEAQIKWFLGEEAGGVFVESPRIAQ